MQRLQRVRSRHGPGILPLLVLLLVGLSGGAAGLAGQTMDVPVETQVPLFLKLLGFDRNLHPQVGGELTVGIVYQGGNRESLVAKELALTLMRDSSIKVDGRSLHIVLIDLDQREIGEALTAHAIAVIYVAPLRAVDVRTIARASRAALVRSFTGVTRYVDQGLAIGVGLRGDLPQIIINLPAARLEGADYPAQLLKLARVVQ